MSVAAQKTSDDKIRRTSAGSFLKEAREARRFAVPKVAEATRIPERLILNLEADEYEKLPPDAFVRGMIARYAMALGVDPTEALSKFSVPRKPGKMSGSRDLLPANRFSPHWTFSLSFRMTYLGWLLAIAAFLYLAFEVKTFLNPPGLALANPAFNNLVVHEPVLLLSGRVYGSRGVSVNGERLSTDKSGEFVYELKLAKGENAFKVEARNRFGKTVTLTRSVFFEPQEMN